MKKIVCLILVASLFLGTGIVAAARGDTLEQTLIVWETEWGHVVEISNYVERIQNDELGLIIINVELPSDINVLRTVRLFGEAQPGESAPRGLEINVFNLESWEEYLSGDGEYWPAPVSLNEREVMRFTSGLYYIGCAVEIPGEEVPYEVMIEVISPTDPLDSASGWARDDIVRAIGLGLVPEDLQSFYHQTITNRAEFCALAVRLYEKVKGEEITERIQFSDTNDINVEKMGALEVISGHGDGTFGPDDPLQRQHAARILARLANSLDKPLTPYTATFSDMNLAASWAEAEIGQMQLSRIMTGHGDGTFGPTGDYTREQSIVTILRLYDILTG
jgi:hypothetical protein